MSINSLKPNCTFCFFPPQVSRESCVGAAVRLSGESPPALALRGQGVLGEPRRGPGPQVTDPHRGAEREDYTAVHQGQEAPTQQGPVI